GLACMMLHLFVRRSRAHRVLPSFPTRRSSDLPVRNPSAQRAVMEGRLQALLPGVQKQLAPLFFEIKAAHGLVEILGPQLLTLDKGDDGAVHEDGLENLRDVQVEGETPEVSGVEEPDAGIQMGLV